MFLWGIEGKTLKNDSEGRVQIIAKQNNLNVSQMLEFRAQHCQ